jgi:hypothetical protein
MKEKHLYYYKERIQRESKRITHGHEVRWHNILHRGQVMSFAEVYEILVGSQARLLDR